MATIVPEIVIGIDFGMTCTGVAFSKGPEWPDPNAIQRWPGTFSATRYDKVKTAVCYDGNGGHLVSWGFLCDPDDESLDYWTHFKLYLDPMYKDPDENAPTHTEARKWFGDYLRSLYKYISKHLGDTVATHLGDMRVEFIFSIPTTWKNPSTHATIENLIKSAGFGSASNHRVEIMLTEAEAAAISASKQQMYRDEVFLVCDAGGGTTDLNVLKVRSVGRNQTQLEPLSSNEGSSIGSTVIDYRIRIKLEKCLRPVQSHLRSDIRTTVHKMMQDRYEGFKCTLGEEGMNVPTLQMPIPDFPPGRDYPEACIEDSRLVLKRWVAI
ncbi:hypothetical protein LTR17_023739 [Elasticomyces elasticus]|nr:hypothetical protein LTR17_023739 [Elasticomyces elasticus]